METWSPGRLHWRVLGVLPGAGSALWCPQGAPLLPEQCSFLPPWRFWLCARWHTRCDSWAGTSDRIWYVYQQNKDHFARTPSSRLQTSVESVPADFAQCLGCSQCNWGEAGKQDSAGRVRYWVSMESQQSVGLQGTEDFLKEVTSEPGVQWWAFVRPERERSILRRRTIDKKSKVPRVEYSYEIEPESISF